MGWAHCGFDGDGRPIGYGVAATCDHPGCTEAIDRGLGHVCGNMHGGNEFSCGKYFCSQHMKIAKVQGTVYQLCIACCEKVHDEDEDE